MHVCFRKALAVIIAAMVTTALPTGVGTYPNATNPPGEPPFYARPKTPSVNGLTTTLLTKNPNLNPANGAGATNPFRLDRSQAVTRDQGHGYKAEQQAFDSGLTDLFPLFVGKAGPPPAGAPTVADTTGLNLGYFDGNTVTALWIWAHVTRVVRQNAIRRS